MKRVQRLTATHKKAAEDLAEQAKQAWAAIEDPSSSQTSSSQSQEPPKKKSRFQKDNRAAK